MSTTGDSRLLRSALDACPDAFLVHDVDSAAGQGAAGVAAGEGAVRFVAGNPAGQAWWDDAGGALTGDLAGLVVAAALAGHSRQARLAHGGGAWDALATPFGGSSVVTVLRAAGELVREQEVLATAYEATAAVRATLQNALDATSDAFAVFEPEYDDDGRLCGLCVVMTNVAGAFSFDGREPDDLIGRQLSELYPQSLTNGLWGAVEDSLRAETARSFRVHQHAPDGSWAGAWDNTIAPGADGRVTLIWRDVSAEHRRQRELAEMHALARHSATHDALTGLANRLLLVERLRAALGTLERIAVVYLDLDRFKQINDTLGHAAGDELLVAVATRLSGFIRHGDLAARLGGDEFVVLLRDLPADWRPDDFVRRAGEVLWAPVVLSGTTLVPSGSLGVAISPPTARTVEDLLHIADEQMYAAKAKQRQAAAGRSPSLRPSRT